MKGGKKIGSSLSKGIANNRFEIRPGQRITQMMSQRGARIYFEAMSRSVLSSMLVHRINRIIVPSHLVPPPTSSLFGHCPTLKQSWSARVPSRTGAARAVGSGPAEEKITWITARESGGAVITGATQGIGLATAKLFVSEGPMFFITCRRHNELEDAVSVNRQQRHGAFKATRRTWPTRSF